MDVTLSAEPRTQTGTGPARRLRADGKVPAVVYGMGTEAKSITVDWKELRKVLTTDAGMNALVELTVDGDSHLSIIKDLQRHAIRRNVVHVDFQLIDRNAPLDIDVPIVLIGEAPAVEQLKGMIDQLKHTLTVKARPGNIPNQLELDISHLEIGTSAKVGDVVLPEGVTTDLDPEEPIAMGSATRSTILLQTGVDPDAGDGAGEGEGGDGEAAPEATEGD